MKLDYLISPVDGQVNINAPFEIKGVFVSNTCQYSVYIKTTGLGGLSKYNYDYKILPSQSAVFPVSGDKVTVGVLDDLQPDLLNQNYPKIPVVVFSGGEKIPYFTTINQVSFWDNYEIFNLNLIGLVLPTNTRTTNFYQTDDNQLLLIQGFYFRGLGTSIDWNFSLTWYDNRVSPFAERFYYVKGGVSNNTFLETKLNMIVGFGEQLIWYSENDDLSNNLTIDGRVYGVSVYL